jgi:hypothetical protein
MRELGLDELQGDRDWEPEPTRNGLDVMRELEGGFDFLSALVKDTLCAQGPRFARRSRRESRFAEDLPDPLAGQAELLADLFERQPLGIDGAHLTSARIELRDGQSLILTGDTLLAVHGRDGTGEIQFFGMERTGVRWNYRSE